MNIALENSYARLPARFYARLDPERAPAPRLIAFNRALASELCLDTDALIPHAAAIFSGAVTPEGATPLAAAYAGHQFGHFVPQLGDGRALLLGEVIDCAGRRRDIQLKGSGRTPFSRGGDGKAPLGPVLREYLIAEAMHAMSVPTTRALAAVLTGERVYRDEVLPGAVLTRVAASHVRVGTFQYFAARGDVEGLRALVDFVVDRHDPELAGASIPALELIGSVVARQARLVAQWLSVGFVHGVMNTDNMAVSGETIDYGPCAFLDAFDPAAVFSSIDRGGRYAYANQPRIAQWNLARFAETLLPLIDADADKAVAAATEKVQGFAPAFDAAWLAAMRAKIGLATAEDGDADLIGALLDAMHRGAADFTGVFRALSEGGARAFFADPSLFDAWERDWLGRLAHDPQSPEARRAAMRAVNPAVIPRNHRVEAALAAAVERLDFEPFESLLAAVVRPFADPPPGSLDALPPQPDERVCRTFCGT